MQNDLIWELCSSDGWNSIRCCVTNYVADDNIIAALDCRGQFWDRSRMLQDDGFDDAELVSDYILQLPQVAISKKQLVCLEAKLVEWLDSPKPLAIELGIEHQVLGMSLNEQEHLISSIEKPVCELTYQVARLQLISRFTVDQSCLNNMRIALSRWLAEWSRDSKPDAT